MSKARVSPRAATLGKPEPAKTKFADFVANAATGEPLRDGLRKPADPAVHYSFGALLGVDDGLAAEGDRTATAGFGVALEVGRRALGRRHVD